MNTDWLKDAYPEYFTTAPKKVTNLVVQRGEGVHLYTMDGDKYLDFVQGVAANAQKNSFISSAMPPSTWSVIPARCCWRPNFGNGPVDRISFSIPTPAPRWWKAASSWPGILPAKTRSSLFAALFMDARWGRPR
jgi:hypothetical protein